jgi:hypothetical protein
MRFFHITSVKRDIPMFIYVYTHDLFTYCLCSHTYTDVHVHTQFLLIAYVHIHTLMFMYIRRSDVVSRDITTFVQRFIFRFEISWPRGYVSQKKQPGDCLETCFVC